MSVETTTRSRAEPTMLTTRQRQQLQLRCVSYLAEGLSIVEISEKEGLTIWHTRQVLDGINREARDGILSNMIAERVPLQVEVALETNRILTKKCMSIMNSSKDQRVVLQAVAQIASLVEKSNEILYSSTMIAKAVQKVLVLPHAAAVVKTDDTNEETEEPEHDDTVVAVVAEEREES